MSNVALNSACEAGYPLKNVERAMLALEEQEPELSCTAIDEVFDGIVQGVLALMLCLKHPAFHEEREWRVVYRPGFEASEYMQSRIVTIRGTEQLIYELPLRDDPKLGIFGIKPKDLLERAIVGPTENAKGVQAALVAALETAGFTDAASRVTCSNVPYREIT